MPLTSSTELFLEEQVQPVLSMLMGERVGSINQEQFIMQSVPVVREILQVSLQLQGRGLRLMVLRIVTWEYLSLS